MAGFLLFHLLKNIQRIFGNIKENKCCQKQRELSLGNCPMSQVCSNDCYGYNLQLLEDLFESNYSTFINPGSDKNIQTDVYVFFTLVKLLSLTTTGSITVTGALTLAWIDPRLRWNYFNYNNLSVIDIPTNKVWTPRITMMNGVSQALSIDLVTDSVASVSFLGKVVLAVSRQFDASCSVDLKYFPFDSQTCSFTFQSIDLRGYQYGSVKFVPAPEVNTEIYTPSGEFALSNATMTSGFRNLRSFNLTLPTFSVCLSFDRIPNYYIGTVAVPALLLLMSSGLVFLLPSDSNVKIGMACSLMVALYVLQQAVARLLPSSQSTSLLSIGIMIELGLACYSLTCAIVQMLLQTVQPALSERCAKFLLACEPYLYTADHASRGAAADTVEPLHVAASPSQAKKVNELAAAIYALIKSNQHLVERAESLQQEKNDRGRLWKVMDVLLGLVFLSVYVAIAIATTVMYLFGVN